MPIYEYVCSRCQSRFEKLVRRFGEEVSCPSCASAAVDKQLSVFAVGASTAGPSFAGCGDGGCAAAEGGCGAGACGSRFCGMPN